MPAAGAETARRAFTTAGAVLAGLAVAAGAFGAHWLRNRLAPADLAIYETAARYQMYHSLALLLAAVIPARHSPRILRAGCRLFLAGILFFSGSLYALALSGQRWLGALTPLGGAAFLAGWACLALAAFREPPPAGSLPPR
jgi:uncharacterized membrane protein YgdD (TMEM256/DUF423 family)